MNPFREDLVSRSRPEPCSIVIFGATGDLTHRKLVPALYNLAVDGELPTGVRIIGFARRDKSDEEFRSGLEELNKKVSRSGHDDEVWSHLAENIFYHKSEFNDADGYKSLAERLDQIDEERGGKGNRLFYIASAPEFFDDILIQLKNAGLNEAKDGCWARVIVEKPFGTDLATAKHLNEVVNSTFHESATYRIDHYLGKETAQNLMVLRFANAIFEPLWNSRYISHMQITCAENLGMEGGRGGYYEKSGALRDMVQNHLLQLLSLVAMEPPTDLSADGVRDEKVKVIRSLRQWDTPEKVAENVVRAQYTAGHVDGKEVLGYRQEDRVSPESDTEAYVAVRLLIDTWRWSGVPFYIRMGKQLPKKSTEISVHFKDAPNVLFGALTGGVPGGNVLVIRIQPDEGISLRMVSKIPGTSLRLEPVKMDFHYSTSFGKGSPEAYERLLLDAIAGDATLFARRDEVEEAWRFIDHIEHAWHQSDNPPPMAEYVAGSWGPKEADDLIKKDGHDWRRL
ncbi:glucose-6-phosphate dehydrogenase [Luteolibacter pohnpeiensis]|uniref:Glucose-6-phosphate 1-dehydrogenase n=1 Tax=Luteolibacter pohnpeiensis TaxID=454153 RepID=A0A934S8N4_9BACT|nr:glucose-6-phosphate dehydrogenase [Luteolibacter pohnpeiensis]MBK1881394.1 glucose-6-phosphate dehydrogenase [Luteolibacter pohnpeiensis]